MLFWVFLILGLSAAALIAAVVFKHWKEIRLLDPDTIRAEQERKTRTHIVAQRFQRRLEGFMTPVKRVGRGMLDRIMQSYRQVEERLSQASSSGNRSLDEPSERTRLLLGDAQVLARDGKFAEAERAYLEILKLDGRQIDAYRGLAALYLTQRQYAQAKELYRFLERIHGADDACYAGLAEIAEATGDVTAAETMRKRAVDMAPKNAVRHAELAGYYLAHGSPEFARASARRAVDLDPDQPRHLEICLESAILVADRKEAERCYDRLRLLSGDPSRLRSYREKIDALSIT